MVSKTIDGSSILSAPARHDKRDIEMANRIVNYVKSCCDEMKRVSWPTMDELTNSTVVVFVASLIIALIVFVMDMLVGVHPTMFWKGLLGYLYQLMG